jgi:putative ABC transport system permease protein
MVSPYEHDLEGCMRRLRYWGQRVAGLFGASRHQRELAEEIESHLQMHTQDNLQRGMSPDGARRAAVLQLGSPEALKEQYRDQNGIPLLEHLFQDLRYAGRTLRRSPGFTALAALTVAVGVAGPTVMFSMAKAWILDPLPFAEPDALLDLRNLDSVSGDTSSVASADFLDWSRTSQSIDIAGYRQRQFRVTGAGRAERLRGAEVTPNFFALLGVQPANGRLLDSRDAQPGSTKVAVISSGMWREHFSADPAHVGRTVHLDGEDYVIVGVLPERFQFTLMGQVSVWTALSFTPDEAANRRRRAVLGIGRLRESRTVEQARAELTGIAGDLSKKYPDTNARRTIRVTRLADEIRRHHDLGFLIPVLFAMVVCVLLVACVNVTNVMLARTSTRRQEVAVRLALGASRRRIVQQWLVEHVLLFVGASLLGVLLAVYGTNWVTQSIPIQNRQYLRNYAVLPVDRIVLLFAVLTGAACGVVFGWLPAWMGAKGDVQRDLRDTSARATTGKAGARLRSGLVVCEVSLALALLVSAGLLVVTSRNITHVDVGFEPRNLLTFQLSLDPAQYRNDAAVRSFYEQLSENLARQPGVLSAGAASLVPFGTEGRGTEFFIEGRPDPPASDTPFSALSQVTSEYAATVGLRLRRGRLLSASDGADEPKVAMINETLAARQFGDRDPVGQRIRLGRQSPDFWTIVGVVGDVKNYETIDSPQPQTYVPAAQRVSRQMTMVARTAGEPETFAGIVRGVVAGLDPAEPLSDVIAMEGRIHLVTGAFETMSTFVTFLGMVTLLLAGVGIYGVISYTFAQRTREIGIRMALGATRHDVAQLVLRQIRTFLAVGIVPGLTIAWILGHAMKAMLVGVTPTDWRLYLGMSIVLATVAVVAGLVPARRATTIDPMTALRYE